MTDERIKLLEEIGFEWTVTKSAHDAKWLNQFDQLSKFHAKHGHCKVPTTFCHQLAQWVNTQQYRPPTKQDRIDALNSLGFYE